VGAVASGDQYFRRTWLEERKHEGQGISYFWFIIKLKKFSINKWLSFPKMYLFHIKMAQYNGWQASIFSRKPAVTAGAVANTTTLGILSNRQPSHINI